MAKQKKPLLELFFIGIFWIVKNVLKFIVLGVYYFFKHLILTLGFLIRTIFRLFTGRKKNKNTADSKDSDKSEKSEENADENNNVQTKGKLKQDAKYEQLNEIEKLSGDFGSFEEKLGNKSVIGIILGARGSGKSAVGMKILENVVSKTGRKAYAMGFNASSLPRWINIINNIKDIKNDSVVLVDEAGITFSSRSAMSNANKLLSKLLFIARHKDLSVLFISQNSSNIEINAIRQADFLLLKQGSLMQKDFERKKIQEIYSEVSDGFEKFSDVKGVSYIYSDVYRGFVENSLPSFWSENLSRSFK